jgi:hypothetical protein
MVDLRIPKQEALHLLDNHRVLKKATILKLVIVGLSSSGTRCKQATFEEC